MELIFFYWGLPGIIGSVLLYLVIQKFRDLWAGRRLKRWAGQNGYEIIHSEARSFFKGPFFGRTPEGHDVLKLTVRDREGRTREAFVAIGGSDSLDVRWKD